MKKRISLIMAISIILLTLSGISAGAVPYTVGTKQDFETSFTTGDALVTFVRDENYGGVLKLESSSERSGGQISFDFSPAVKKGKYVLSFDMLMSDTDTNMLIYTRKYNKDKDSFENMSFMALREGGKVCTYPNNQWSFPQIGDAVFEAGKWQRYDLVMDFDTDNETDTKWGEVYVDGVLRGEMNLTANSINAMDRMLFVFADYGKAGKYALLDNMEMREFDETVAMSAVRNVTGEFEVNFSETMPPLTESSFSLTKTPIDGGEAENVSFSLKYSTPTKAVIVPDSAPRGYSYTLTAAAGLQSAMGSKISNRAYTVDVPFSKALDKKWDFEDGKAPGGNTEIAELENRGKVLRYKKSADVQFRIDPIDSGVYLYSYDLMRTNSSVISYMLIRAYPAAGNWKQFEALFDSGRFGNFGTAGNPSGGWGVIPLGDKTMEDNTWYRIDNIMDMDSKKALVYCDGEYLGEIDLAGKGLNEFSGVLMSANFYGTVTDADSAYYDNIRIRDVRDTYGASLTADGKKLYIDFDETTVGLTDDSFTVTRADSPLSADAETVNAKLIYQNGARAVLELEKEARDGDFFTVTFNNVSSFLKNRPAGSVSYREAVHEPGTAMTGEAWFEAVNGEKSSAAFVPSSTKKIIISYPSGMQGSEFNGSAEVTCDGEAADYSGEWDDAAKTYTLTFKKLLGANKTYNIRLSGSYSADGAEYKTEAGSFTTSDGVFELSNVGFEKTAEGIRASFECVNTKESGIYRLVWTGYDRDGSLLGMDYAPVELEADSAETVKTAEFVIDNISELDKISVYIWKSFSDILPVANSASGR